MQFVRANLSSIVATALTWLAVVILTSLGVHYLAAATLGAVTGAITDFALKRYWAFHRSVRGGLVIEAFRYFMVSSGSLAWNLALSYMLVDGLRLAPAPGVILSSTLIGVVWNYPLHRAFVFRQVRSF